MQVGLQAGGGLLSGVCPVGLALSLGAEVEDAAAQGGHLALQGGLQQEAKGTQQTCVTPTEQGPTWLRAQRAGSDVTSRVASTGKGPKERRQMS